MLTQRRENVMSSHVLRVILDSFAFSSSSSSNKIFA